MPKTNPPLSAAESAHNQRLAVLHNAQAEPSRQVRRREQRKIQKAGWRRGLASPAVAARFERRAA